MSEETPPSPIWSALVWISLAGILFAGAWLRFTHLDWDGMNQLHPDERAILFIASQIHVPDHLADALSPQQSRLNPLRTSVGEMQAYPYGHFHLYAVVLAHKVLSLPCIVLPCNVFPEGSLTSHLLNARAEPSFTHLTYSARAISALSDTLAILATFLLTRRLFGAWPGVVAAGLMAFAVLHIQNARFGTVDALLALFAVLTLWLLVRYSVTGARRDSILAGICMGLALGCKATAVLLTIPFLAAHLRYESIRLTRPWINDARIFWLSAVVGGLTFLLTNPYVLLDPTPFLMALATQAQVTSGAVDWPFTRQYIGTLPIWYYVEQQARWLLGSPLAVAGYAGFFWIARRAVKTRSRSLTIIVWWACAILLTIGMQHVKFPRYMMPLTPILCCCAAGLLTHHIRTSRRGLLVQGSAALMTVAVTAIYAFTFARMYKQPHPWVAASEWIYQELPPGMVIASEQWDDPLPLDLIVRDSGYLRESFYDSRLVAAFSEPDDVSKLDTLLHEVSAADYIILSSNRLYGVIPLMESRYPLTGAYYKALFSGDLGYVFERSFARYPQFLGMEVADDPFAPPSLPDPRPAPSAVRINLGPADESFTVYDHPLVLIFRNTQRLSAASMRDIVTQYAAEHRDR